MRRALFLLFKPQAMPPRAARWFWALGLSLAAHGWWLIAGGEPRAQQAAANGAPMQTRRIAAPAAAPADRPAEPQRPAPPARHRQPIAGVPVQASQPPIANPPPELRIAPAAEWRYQLSQGGRQGTAWLSWQVQDGAYQLLLTRELDGKALPGWRSQGSLDERQGLAPQRYATQRRGHDAQATNFRREEGLISFSASSEQFALIPGVQDRISWWLQLAARVAGAPQRFVPGSEIRLSVAGLRGEPAQWVFEVIGEETIALPQQVVVSALHLQRAALGPYDGAIDIWLDPSRGHLPVKLASGRPDEPQGWELQLTDDKAGPPR